MKKFIRDFLHIENNPSGRIYRTGDLGRIDENGAFGGTATSNDGGITNTATVSIAITAVNDAPVASNDNYNTPEDTLLTVAAPGGDSAFPGNALCSIPRVPTRPASGSSWGAGRPG